MIPYRRCGVSNFVVLFALLTLLPCFIQAQVLTQVQSGARSAGSGSTNFNADFGAAATVNLNSPSYLVFDSIGNQYVSDTQNNCIRKIDASGSVSTVAGLAVSGQGDTCNTASNATPTAAQGLYRPTGLAIDANNRLYIADSMHHCVRSLAAGATGVASMTTVAGTCGSVSTASVTPMPNGLVLDGSNNLYIALQDSISATPVYQVVRHTDSANALNVCYLAGTASANVATACAGISNGITLNKPAGLAIDVAGDLFIADMGNNCIREVAGMTTQKTAVGKCTNDSTGNANTTLHSPYGVTLSPMQTLFITESAPDNVVSYVLGANTLSVVAGLPSGLAGAYSSSQDGKSALSAPLNSPRGIALDSMGNFTVADSGNNITRKLSGNILFPSTPIGSNSASMPISFAVNQAVNLNANIGPDFYVVNNSCTGNLGPASAGAPPTVCQVFVRFTPTRPGVRSTPLYLTDTISHTTITVGLQSIGTGPLAVFTPGTVNTAASALAAPIAVVTDATGNAFVLEAGTTAGTADLRMIPAAGGTAQIVIPQGAGLTTPTALAMDSAGDFFIADATHGTVARFNADGSINTSYITGLDSPTAIAVDGFGTLYIAQAGTSHNVLQIFGSSIRRIIAGGGSNTTPNGVPAISASFAYPAALAMDINGILYISDSWAHFVYAVDKGGIIHTVAGNGTTNTTTPGQATGTALIEPAALALDAAGDLYIADSGTNRIYTVYASSNNNGNNIDTILGTGGSGNSGDGGFGTLAKLRNPVSVALDGNGYVFVADYANSSVRKLTYPTPTLAFGPITVGQTSPVLTQLLSNFGTDNLNITSNFSTTDTRFNVAQNATTCGTSILTGSTCGLGYTFTPTGKGNATANGTVFSNAPNSPQPVFLTGIGKQVEVLTVTAIAQSEVYGQGFNASVNASGVDPAATGTITFTTGTKTLCTVSGTLATITTCNAPNSGLAVGTYPVTFTYSGDTNYFSTSGTTTLTIAAAPLSITVNNVSRAYGVANPTFNGTLSGVVAGETILVSYSTAATANSPVGTYAITATLTTTGSASLTNYTVTNTPGTLTITQNMNSLVINVNSASRLYGASNPAFNGTVNGVVSGDNVIVTYSTTATATSSAGRYAIGANVSGTSAGNYVATITPGTLLVSAAGTTTTVTTSSNSIVLGDSVTYRATVTSSAATPSGVVTFSDGTTVLGSATLNASGIATFTTTALTVGTHSISAAFQANTNFTPSAATLNQAVTQPVGSFTLSATPDSTFIKGAGVTSFQLTVASTGQFAGQVALSCAGLPADATCAFSGNPTLTVGGTATVTVNITTTVADAKLNKPAPFAPADLAPITAATMFPVELTGFGVLFVGIRRRPSFGSKTLGSQRMRLLLILVFTLGILGLTGCGCPNTNFRTYTVNITGTSVSFPTATQTTSVVLSVGQQ